MTIESADKNWHPATLAVHRGVYQDTSYNSVTTPIYPSSTFAFERFGVTKGYDYSRSGNPTRSALEDNLAALEGGQRAWATSTGMSAISTLAFLLKTGDHIVAGHDIYSGTIRLLDSVLPAFGVTTSFVQMGDLSAVRRAVQPNTRMLFIETPSNPLLRVVDIGALTAIGREHGLTTVVDNTFMSPYLQQPLRLGADIVVHSTTKYLNGHSDVVGGAIIVGNDGHLQERLGYLVNALGVACSPFDAWLVLRGIKTLPLRMEAHQRNASAVAHWLERHPVATQVHYPGLSSHPDHDLASRQMAGFGGMVSFELDQGRANLERFIDSLALFRIAESLGGVESLAEHPWSMSHASISVERRQAAGITPGTIRLSMGIEHNEDLIADLEQALNLSQNWS